MKNYWFYCFLHLLLSNDLMAEENFVLVNGTTHQTLMEIGPHLDERVTPCSTFKIALSLMGFDAGILVDENSPVWLFQEGYDDFLESWKNPQNPQSWLKTSCVWYSRVLAKKIGLNNFKSYITSLDYGNQDISGGLTESWLSSSLKISPIEQIFFIEKLMNESLPISMHAIQMTKNLMFIEQLSNGWKLFVKTGGGSIDTPNGKNELGWFVGWIEKDEQFFSFAYNIRGVKIDFSQRIIRVKQLLDKSKTMIFIR